MGIMKTLAILLIVAGVLGLAYGGFTYTQATHEAQLGPIGVSVDENRSVSIPVWISMTSIAVGGVALFFGGKFL
ncbi:hypothetical protein C8D99_10774 [Aminivibrio pyruvatiphilus]|uniref:Uncharacterized protein n=1 Tax=Aminivibrio pyruvatiphilus TaxID=1005740 RepID=A0A4R8M9X2_9BACT|nr:hypothetical protein [Aminivibrio pyruvatiphilus]TDY60867.1 hypothetical protein C8D99_10774 [Aminivibrio pyruvatiphilus]